MALSENNSIVARLSSNSRQIEDYEGQVKVSDCEWYSQQMKGLKYP